MTINFDNQRDIYRKTPIVQPSPEHILQDGLGCDLQATGLIGHQMNTDFGGTIDKALLEDYALFRALLGLETRRRRPIPVEASGGSHNLLGDKPVSKKSGRPFEITERPDGRKDIRIQARSMEEAKKLARHAMRSIGAEGQTPVEVTATSVQTFAPPIEFPVRFGGPVQFRAIAKACFNALAVCKGPTTLLGHPFDPIRDYILYGVDQAAALDKGLDPQPNFCCFDFRLDLFPALQLPQQPGPLDHRLVIRGSAGTGVVYATMELFGHLPFSTLLTSAWTGEDFCWALLADPVPGGSGHRTIDLAIDARPTVAADVVCVHALDRAALLTRCQSLLKPLFRLVEDRCTDTLIQGTLRSVFGVPDGTPITREQIGRLSQELAERFVRQEFRIESRTPIDPPPIG